MGAWMGIHNALLLWSVYWVSENNLSKQEIFTFCSCLITVDWKVWLKRLYDTKYKPSSVCTIKSIAYRDYWSEQFTTGECRWVLDLNLVCQCIDGCPRCPTIMTGIFNRYPHGSWLQASAGKCWIWTMLCQCIDGHLQDSLLLWLLYLISI